MAIATIGLAKTSIGVGVVAGLSEDALRTWVAASCARHGVPVKVTDVAVIAVADGTAVTHDAGIPA